MVENENCDQLCRFVCVCVCVCVRLSSFISRFIVIRSCDGQHFKRKRSLLCFRTNCRWRPIIIIIVIKDHRWKKGEWDRTWWHSSQTHTCIYKYNYQSFWLSHDGIPSVEALDFFFFFFLSIVLMCVCCGKWDLFSLVVVYKHTATTATTTSDICPLYYLTSIHQLKKKIIW